MNDHASAPVDFGRTASDYARHRAGFPDALFTRLGAPPPGVPPLAVDVGTGTGTVARGLARQGWQVVGVDVSPALLAEARRLAADLPQARFQEGRAEDTGLPAGCAGLVTAGQCWHWFDRPRAAAEARRLLVPGGRLVITHMDWVELKGNVVEATEALIRAHGGGSQARRVLEHGHGVGVYPAWLRDVGEAGFTDVETFSFDVAIPYTHEAWRGRVRASAGVGASLPPDAVERFDALLAATLTRDFPAQPLQVPHRIWAVVARAP